jgi:predicted RNA-binding Zn-ribbon protein involved in translation (DUF1610 family)
MTRRNHIDALAIIVERALDAQRTPRARRLLDVEIASVECHALTDAGEAREPPRAIRIRRIVETCRDKHLASLDVDEGLTVLGIDWEEVVLALRRHRRERAATARRRCPRCEAKMEPLEIPQRSHRARGSDVVYRCPACGLGLR